MGVILKPKRLRNIDRMHSHLTREKLDGLIDNIFDEMSETAKLHAAIQDSDNAQRKDEVLVDFKNAWDFAMDNYNGHLDLDFIRSIAGRAEPSLRPTGTDLLSVLRGSSQALYNLEDRDSLPFRLGCGIGFQGIGYVPPADGYRVLEHIRRTTDIVENYGLHPVEEAIFTYFHIARIQPFENGNKRTANLLMNMKLLSDGYAPITIPTKERGKLEHLFAGALMDFRDAGSQTSDESYPYIVIGEGQSRLYEFLGTLEENALKTTKAKVDEIPHYKVETKGKHVGVMYSAKKHIDSWFRQKDLPHMVKVENKNINVMGKIPYQVLDKIMESHNHIRSYKIKQFR